MRKLLIVGLLTAAASTAPAAASVLPYGVQTNISAGDIAGWGFTQCFSGSYAGNENIATILSGCQGGALMMASKAVGSNTFNVAAAGLREDVLFSPSSINYNNYNNLPASERTLTHEANGVEWYFGDHWSWGFAPADASVDRYSCDVGPGNVRTSVCAGTPITATSTLAILLAVRATPTAATTNVSYSSPTHPAPTCPSPRCSACSASALSASASRAVARPPRGLHAQLAFRGASERSGGCCQTKFYAIASRPGLGSAAFALRS